MTTPTTTSLTLTQYEALCRMRESEGVMTAHNGVSRTTAQSLVNKGFAEFAEGSSRTEWVLHRIPGMLVPGDPIPPEQNFGQTGYVVGVCGHRIARQRVAGWPPQLRTGRRLTDRWLSCPAPAGHGGERSAPSERNNHGRPHQPGHG